MELLRSSLFSDLIITLSNITTDNDSETQIVNYLNSINKLKEFDELKAHSNKLNSLKKLEWLNTSKALDIQNDLKGKLVLIDFWTYCCINCMHVIPLLNQLEHEFKEMIVIGVHSSKFSNEKSKSNILSAIKRHLIKHPVACDFNQEIWNSLEIICWPTFLVLNPDGLIIAEFQGEIQANLMKKFLKCCFKFYSEKLNNSTIDFGNHLNQIFTNKISSNNLNSCYFPTKLFYNSDQKLLFVSDSGNNRVLVIDTKTNRIKYSIGSGKQGFCDSNFSNSQFDWPQGLCFDKETNILYIADTFNNLIRTADLNTFKVSTLCGVQSNFNQQIGDYDYVGGKKGLEQQISSPWDVCIFNKDNSKVLLIACAGTHQIWLYSFENKAMTIKFEFTMLNWWKNMKINWETLVCIAGNGKERNKNNSYPLQASFAQPSGLCLDLDGQNVYIADAESSTIRLLSLKDGSVKGLIGGDNLQPDNLFAYGDVDGKGSEAKLQHPLDVRYYFNKNQNENHYLIVADTYNNSLKKVDLKSKTCQKLLLKNDFELKEPNGIAMDLENNIIWIADTNSHSIKIIKNFNINNNSIEIQDFKVQFYDDVDSAKISLNKLDINKTTSILRIYFSFKLNQNAENSWKLKLVNENGEQFNYTGLFDQDSLTENYLKQKIYKIGFKENFEKLNSIELDINVIYCDGNGATEVCKMYKKKFFFQKTIYLII